MQASTPTNAGALRSKGFSFSISWTLPSPDQAMTSASDNQSQRQDMDHLSFQAAKWHIF